MDAVFVLVNRTLSLRLPHGGEYETFEITPQLIQTFPVSQISGIPSLAAAAAAAVTPGRWNQDIFHKFEQLRQRDARTFLLKHKAQSELLTGGEHKNRGPDEARGCAEGASGAGGAARPCQPGWRQRPVLCRGWAIWSALCWCSGGRRWPSSGNGSR